MSGVTLYDRFYRAIEAWDYRSQSILPARYDYSFKLQTLDPQRNTGIVWDDAKQSGLIDSITMNYHLPPLVFGASCVILAHFNLRTCH